MSENNKSSNGKSESAEDIKKYEEALKKGLGKKTAKAEAWKDTKGKKPQ